MTECFEHLWTSLNIFEHLWTSLNTVQLKNSWFNLNFCRFCRLLQLVPQLRRPAQWPRANCNKGVGGPELRPIRRRNAEWRLSPRISRTATPRQWMIPYFFYWEIMEDQNPFKDISTYWWPWQGQIGMDDYRSMFRVFLCKIIRLIKWYHYFYLH
jgi:hypothetical protein